MNIDGVKVEYIIDDLLDGSDSSHPQEREQEKVRKDLGRWSIYESQRYIDTLRMNEHPKYLVRELRMVMPNRSESQIRAHHQKMLRKYGSVGNILTPSGEILLVSDGGSQWLVDPQRSGLSQLEPDHAPRGGSHARRRPLAWVAGRARTHWT